MSENNCPCEGALQFYIREDGTAAVIHCFAMTDQIDIPPMINGALVIEVAHHAFAQAEWLRTVNFPPTIVSIGKEAFIGCASLQRIALPERLQSIGEGCFAQCFQLRQVILPSSLEQIAPYAFKDCISLQEMHIPANCTDIAATAFEECPSLVGFVVDEENMEYMAEDGILYNKNMTMLICCPESRKTPVLLRCGMDYLPEAFDRCMWLPSVETEDGHELYRSIDGVLYSAEGDKLMLVPQGRRRTVHLSAEVVDIAEVALNQSFMPVQQIMPDGSTDFGWMDCCSLQPFSVDEDNPAFCDVDGVLYDKEQTILIACYGDYEGILEIPQSVTILDCGSVLGCGNLTGVILPDELQMIESAAFSGCVSLRQIDVPASVTEIGAEAFLSCFALERCIIRGMETTIGADAFCGCLNVKIYGLRGSEAEAYAARYGIPFQAVKI